MKGITHERPKIDRIGWCAECQRHIGTLAVNPFIFDKLPYNPGKDFRAISLLAKAPASLPQAAADKLAAAAAKAMKEPSVQDILGKDAAIAVGDTPAEFNAFIAKEQQRWKVVVARAKIKPDN